MPEKSRDFRERYPGAVQSKTAHVSRGSDGGDIPLPLVAALTVTQTAIRAEVKDQRKRRVNDILSLHGGGVMTLGPQVQSLSTFERSADQHPQLRRLADQLPGENIVFREAGHQDLAVSTAVPVV